MLQSADEPTLEVKEVEAESRSLLWRASELLGYTVRATDGEAGKIYDLYFSTKTWTLQAFIVDIGDWVLDTGDWTSGKKVIVPGAAFSQPSREEDVLPVALTRDQVEQQLEPDAEEQQEDNRELYSLKTTLGHYIQANDGEIGHLEDLIIHDQTWMIRFMVVDTRNWWPGKKVMIEPFWITSIASEEAKLYLNLLRDKVQDSPQFDPSLLS
jgi:uncharacterized protein YrrD